MNEELNNYAQTFNRCFKILQKEEQREMDLINDVLDLTRLDAAVEPLNFINIESKERQATSFKQARMG